MLELEITHTYIEDLIVCMGEEGEDVLSGYTITGSLADGRTLWLADVTADTHPAIDPEDHTEGGSPTLEEAKVIAQLLAGPLKCSPLFWP